MKKKVLTMVAIVIMAISASATITAVMGGKWIRISDSCKKCVMSDTERKCGICGGFMESIGKTEITDDNWGESNFRCKKCGHTIRYRWK